MKEDDTNLSPAIPTRYNVDVLAILTEIAEHAGLERSTVMRRAARVLIDEVKRRGGTDWLKDEQPKKGLSFLEGPRKLPEKRKVASRIAATVYRDIFLGDAPAGTPCVGEFRPESWEEKVKVDARKFPHAAFALRVRGESMIGKKIKDGDILIFALPETREPAADDVVCAHIDDEVTIKTLVKRNGKTTLRSENPAYPNPTVTKNSAVQGVMIGKL